MFPTGKPPKNAAGLREHAYAADRALGRGSDFAIFGNEGLKDR